MPWLMARLAVTFLLLAAAVPAAADGSGKVTAAAPSSAQEKAALIVAERWLALVDEGRYEECWDYQFREDPQDSKPTIRPSKSNPKVLERQMQKYAAALREARSPFGKLVARELTKVVAQDKNVEFRFKSSFAEQKTAYEVIICRISQYGRWGILDYRIEDKPTL